MFGTIFRRHANGAGGGRVRREDLQAVTGSALFDPAWYATRYGVSGSPEELARHFLRAEGGQMLDPGPGFSTRRYLEINGDVATSGSNALLHYERFGRAEGRQTAPAEAAPAIQTVQPSDPDIALVKAQFDADFYRATNADLKDWDDLLAHFMAHGWREGRDPCRDFSTEYYLAANPDVRARGVNPFVHYLREGRAEGRFSRPSTAPRPAPSPGTGDAAVALRCGVVALVRNEIDIIKPFVEHLLALFDEIVLIDHRSDDGTLDFLRSVARASDRVTMLQFDEPGYHQALVINHVLRGHAAFDDCDWVFMLDADEFLPFADRTAFHDRLARLAEAPVIAMSWSNLIPKSYWSFEVEQVSDTAYYRSDAPSSYVKVAFQPARIDRDRDWVDQGYHAMRHRAHGLDYPAVKAGFDLLHLPVRSANQLRMKLNQGVLSYLRMGAAREAAQGSHWFRLQEALKDAEITPDILNTVVHTYGNTPDVLTPSAPAVLEAAGYREVTLKIAAAPLDVAATRHADVAELMFRAAADSAAADVAADGPPITALVTLPDGHIRRAEDRPEAEYAALPDEAPQAASSGGEDAYGFLAEALRPSYWEIDDLTPSAWTGHIPFLFCLAAMERPRRYVELGTHFGASFFAYCQASARLGLGTEPVAIDAWMGDDHAGFYDEEVFDRFRFLLRKYESFAEYLRMTFDTAAPRFAEGSIDLLHIDGLHTYEAVRHDFETWLPKMSSRGVMILHDINVHERDFGVWKFWEELRGRYPMLEFRHSHGLGVVYVGSQPDTRIARLIAMTAEDAGLRMLVQQHFEEISQKSAEVFVKRWDLTQMKDQIAQVAQLNQDLSETRQALQTATLERDEMRALLSRGARTESA